MLPLQQEITYGLWLEVDTTNGIEIIPVSAVGRPPWMTQGTQYDYDCDGMPEFLPDLLRHLKLVHHARHVVGVTLVEGYGAYHPDLGWTVFGSKEEAEDAMEGEGEEVNLDLDAIFTDADLLDEFEVCEPGHDPRVVREHGGLYVTCPRCGAEWSVHSCVPGPHSFEQLSFGDGYCSEQLARNERDY